MTNTIVPGVTTGSQAASILNATITTVGTGTLTTSSKNLVGATNELDEQMGSLIDLETANDTTVVGAINEVDTNTDLVTAEVVAARASYGDLNSRINALVINSGSNVAEVVDARGGFDSLSHRLTGMRTILMAGSYGLTGIASAGDVANTQTMFDAASDGAVLYFPAGTYNIADIVAPNGHHLVLDGKSNVIIMGDQGKTIFTSLTGAGLNMYGDYLRINDCDHVEVVGITIMDVDKTLLWSRYDNGIAIFNSSHIDIHHCVFGDTENKHIHIGGNTGTCQDIRIHDNEFYHGSYNANPTPALVHAQNYLDYGSIFMYATNTVTAIIEDIQIFRNHFHDNYLFCVSAIDLPHNIISDVKIYNNLFENCSCGVYASCKRISLRDNTYRNVGWSNILNAYYYVATSDGPPYYRYYSMSRNTYSGTLYTLPPSEAQTISPVVTAALHLDHANESYIVGEHFLNCGVAQLRTDGASVPLSPSIYAISCLRITIRDCIDDESGATSIIKTPLFWIASTTYLASVLDNKFLINPLYAGITAYLIRNDNDDGMMELRGNHADHWGRGIYQNTYSSPVDRFTYTNASPVSGTWIRGDIVWNTAATVAGNTGWICTQTGTVGILNGGLTTGTIDASSASLVVSASADMLLGQHIFISSVSGPKIITAINGINIRLDSVAATPTTASPVSFYPAIWKTFGTIAS